MIRYSPAARWLLDGPPSRTMTGHLKQRMAGFSDGSRDNHHAVICDPLPQAAAWRLGNRAVLRGLAGNLPRCAVQSAVHFETEPDRGGFCRSDRKRRLGE